MYCLIYKIALLQAIFFLWKKPIPPCNSEWKSYIHGEIQTFEAFFCKSIFIKNNSELALLHSRISMNLEKLFGSKAKVDILKYLIFRRQGVSMRALETELWWTFPAIKKQVDGLDEAGILQVDKENTWWAITIKPSLLPLFKELFFESLKQDLTTLFEKHQNQISNYFWWDKFWKPIGMDLILIYHALEKEQIDDLKISINEIFREFRIESASIVFMSSEEREKRYRLADRFVLQVMRFYNTIGK